MYPEGYLIDPEGKNLLSFEKDSMNPINEGYIEFWLVTGINSKQFRYRKRTSTAQAIGEWNNLIRQHWRIVKEREQAA